VILRATFTFVLAAGLMAAPATASRVHRAPTSGHSHLRRHTTAAAAKVHKMHGQQTIDSNRVTAIQQALIREHYLGGEPTAKWDSDTQAAMLKFQADQGWQTKITPDSRALIKLGLGPDHSDAINAGNGANFNQLNAPASVPPTQAQGFVAASGISH
jgi:putative peptidoglycan binding protein